MGPLFIPPKLVDETTSTAAKSSSQPCTSKQRSSLRKFVVLAQDCIAVKMVVVVEEQQQQQQNTQTRIFDSTNKHVLSTTEYNDNGAMLFKLFLDSNKKSYWNSNLITSLSSLSYKGYITPCTILIQSTPHNLNVVRTAWSRRILRDPPGYRIEMIGDIEEIFTQPVCQSQFAPLSDSLCWCIMHLTSNGTEAFVDSIVATLCSSFPGMERPSIELVFQSLEKLIREQKIYQTANGYFIVTPEVGCYIESTNNNGSTRCCSPMMMMSMQNQQDLEERAVVDRMSQWGSVDSILMMNESVENNNNSRFNTLKRHNSMRLVSRRDDMMMLRPHMGARSLSFRLSKRNSILDNDDDVCDDDADPRVVVNELVLVDTMDQCTQVDNNENQRFNKKNRSRRSLLSRLISAFTHNSCSNNKKVPPPVPVTQKPCPPPTTTTQKSTSSTQTNGGFHKQNQNLHHNAHRRRRHSLVHVPEWNNNNTYESLVQGRSSSLSCSRRSSTRSRASSPSSNVSNIYASLRCTSPMTIRGGSSSEYNRGCSRRRASLYDLYNSHHHHHHHQYNRKLLSVGAEVKRSMSGGGGEQEQCCVVTSSTSTRESSDDVSH